MELVEKYKDTYNELDAIAMNEKECMITKLQISNYLLINHAKRYSISVDDLCYLTNYIIDKIMMLHNADDSFKDLYFQIFEIGFIDEELI